MNLGLNEGIFSVLGVIAGITTLGIFSIVVISIMRKDKDNSALYTSILGFLAPTIAILLTLAQVQATGQKVDQLEVKVDGRLTKLLEITEQAARAEGEIVGRDKIKAELIAEDHENKK